jgi:hypothetical protein
MARMSAHVKDLRDSARRNGRRALGHLNMIAWCTKQAAGWISMRESLATRFPADDEQAQSAIKHCENRMKYYDEIADAETERAIRWTREAAGYARRSVAAQAKERAK